MGISIELEEKKTKQKSPQRQQKEKEQKGEEIEGKKEFQEEKSEGENECDKNNEVEAEEAKAELEEEEEEEEEEGGRVRVELVEEKGELSENLLKFGGFYNDDDDYVGGVTREEEWEGEGEEDEGDVGGEEWEAGEVVERLPGVEGGTGGGEGLPSFSFFNCFIPLFFSYLLKPTGKKYATPPLLYVVHIYLPRRLFRRAPAFHSLLPFSLFNTPPIRLVPVLFNQGINEQQSRVPSLPFPKFL